MHHRRIPARAGSLLLVIATLACLGSQRVLGPGTWADLPEPARRELESKAAQYEEQVLRFTCTERARAVKYKEDRPRGPASREYVYLLTPGGTEASATAVRLDPASRRPREIKLSN